MILNRYGTDFQIDKIRPDMIIKELTSEKRNYYGSIIENEEDWQIIKDDDTSRHNNA